MKPARSVKREAHLVLHALQFLLGAGLAAASAWLLASEIEVTNVFGVSIFPESQPIWFRFGFKLGVVLPLVAAGVLMWLRRRGDARAHPLSFMAGMAVLGLGLFITLLIAMANHH